MFSSVKTVFSRFRKIVSNPKNQVIGSMVMTSAVLVYSMMRQLWSVEQEGLSSEARPQPGQSSVALSTIEAYQTTLASSVLLFIQTFVSTSATQWLATSNHLPIIPHLPSGYLLPMPVEKGTMYTLFSDIELNFPSALSQLLPTDTNLACALSRASAGLSAVVMSKGSLRRTALSILFGELASLPMVMASGPSSIIASTQFPATLSLANLTARTGFKITGVASGDRSGDSVSSAGDVNADGINDLIIGAYGAGGTGASYVIFGVSGIGSTEILSFSDLNGGNGFKITGVAAGDSSGYSVSSAGDVNADGINDLIIGAYGVNSRTGASYVIFGAPGIGSTGTLSLADLNGGNGFRITGVATGDVSGYSVSSAGDVNADGINDLIIGACEANSAIGASYVIFGAPGIGSSGTLSLADLNGGNGFKIAGVAAGDRSGYSVSSAGDVNVDGINDLIIGIFQVNIGIGESYVIFGAPGIGSTGTLLLADLNGSNGFRITDVAAGDRSGVSVSSAGDVNANGINDLIIGASGVNGSVGASYVIFGASGIGNTGILSLAGLSGGNGFKIVGVVAGDMSGYSVNSAGDVNADGINDLIIGAPGADSLSGESYVIFGAPGIDSTGTFSLASLSAGNGFKITGAVADDMSGYSVSSVGDVNADGINDLIIGALQANSFAGASYVIFGDRLSFLTRNSLTITKGNTVRLNSSHFNATYFNSSADDAQIRFTISNLTNGYFSNASAPIAPITNFLQQDVLAGSIQFTHDNSLNPPIFSTQLLGNGGLATMNVPQPASITFIHLGARLVVNCLSIKQGHTVNVTAANLQAIDLDNEVSNASLLFILSAVQHGHFQFINAIGVPITAFMQSQLQNVQFVHDGTQHAPNYTVSVSDGSLISAPEAVAILFYSASNSHSLTLLRSSSLSATPVLSNSLSQSNSLRLRLTPSWSNSLKSTPSRSNVLSPTVLLSTSPSLTPTISLSHSRTFFSRSASPQIRSASQVLAHQVKLSKGLIPLEAEKVTVNSVTVLTMLTGLFFPNSANKAANTGRIASVARCTYVEEEYEFNPFLFAPGFSVTFGSGESNAPIINGAIISTTSLMSLVLGMYLLTGQLQNSAQSGKMTKAHRILSAVLALTMSYYGPNVTEIATLSAVHFSAGDRALAIIAQMAWSIVFFLAWYQVYQKTSEKEVTKFSLLPFYEPTRYFEHQLIRSLVFIDMSVASLLAMLAGLRPDSQSCNYIAISMLVVSMGNLGYVVGKRPYRSKLEQGLVTINAVIQVGLSGFSIAVLYKESLFAALQGVKLAAFCYLYLQTAILMIVTLRGRWQHYQNTQQQSEPAATVLFVPNAAQNVLDTEMFAITNFVQPEAPPHLEPLLPEQPLIPSEAPAHLELLLPNHPLRPTEDNLDGLLLSTDDERTITVEENEQLINSERQSAHVARSLFNNNPIDNYLRSYVEPSPMLASVQI